MVSKAKNITIASASAIGIITLLAMPEMAVTISIYFAVLLPLMALYTYLFKKLYESLVRLQSAS